MPATAQVPTPPDTARFVNTASYRFIAEDGLPVTGSTSAEVLLQYLAGLTLAPPRAQAAPAGVRRVLAHVLQNTGTAADAFALAASAPAGWTVAVYIDANANGTLDVGETPAPAAVALARNATIALLLVIDIPASAVAGFVGTLILDAMSLMDNTVRATVQDRITIVQGASANGLVLDKTVDRAAAAAGDTLLYTLAYINAGVAPTLPATIGDVLPLGAHYVAGSLRSGGLPLTDAIDGDAGQFVRDAAGVETIRVAVGVIPVNGGGVVTFRVVVGIDAPAGPLANVATLDDGTPLATSPPATTTVSTATLAVQKTLVGADSVAAGDLVSYSITYSNSSATVAAAGVTIVDTLPADLAFVSADGAPVVSGQVVTWTIGPVGQQSVTLSLVARAVRPSAGLVNRAHLAATNAAGASAAAAPVRIVGWPANLLGLTKSAQVLDVALGEPVPYSLVLRNLGTVPLVGFVVRDLLPAGMRFVPASLAGADSALATGQLLTIWLTGILAPSEERTVRYAAVLTSAGANRSLTNLAVAEAEGGLVVSDTASAAVRVRAGYAMQGRTLLGKIFLDRNDNGVQDAGEEGVAGAEILTADGQVVTADKEGRYSLRDVAPGTHALRIDTLTAIPKGFGLARTADEIVVVRTDGWTTPRADFRLVPRAAPKVECPDSLAIAAAAVPVRLAAALTAPRLAPLRSAADRDGEERNAFIAGPTVRIASPVDGAVLGSNRVYVGVKGEPGTTVTLYEGEKKVGEAVLRPDGVQDFIGVELTPGPHKLRARIVNSWKNERWDSVAVHRSGLPTAIELVAADTTKPLILRVDAESVTTVRVRVLDAWKVPVATLPDLTVEASGATLDGADSDAGSLGQQRRADAHGVVTVALRAGHTVGDGRLTVRAGEKVFVRRAIRVLPTLRALMATGAGQIGVGAAGESFGAVSARGAIGRETSLSMSYDSRRGGENDFFGRGFDPLDEARYATYGDGSERRVLSGATQRFSARLERGLDWVELGDVVARPATDMDGLLAGYQRSLSGVSTRLSAGALTFRGFGSMTRQALQQEQLRGDGGSGPYVFGAGARPGTDRVSIEVRARDNAARVISRQTLTRFSDYEIDYATGAVLLRRPVPANDPYGNPVFIVAALERETGGAQHFVGGGRVEANVGSALRLRDADSLVVAVTGVRDGGAAGAGASTIGSTDILGADVRLRTGGLTLGGELLRTTSADSSGSAARASLRWTLPDERASFGAHWMRVEQGMTGTLDPRLGAGLSELHLDGALKLSESTRLQVAHDRQHFAQYGVDRQTTTGSAKTSIGGRAVTQEIGLSTDVQGTGAEASSLTGKTTVAVASRVDAWVEGSHALRPGASAPAAPTLTTRPDHMGVGVAYRITPALRLEATHRVSTIPDTVAGQSTRHEVTSLDLRTSTLFGGEAWGGVERAGSTRASHAAVLGWNQRLAVGGGWAVRTLYERRVGLSSAALVDPARALPFARTEGDRWSVGGGLEWLPTSDHSRFSLNGEARNGDGRRGSRFTLGGDAPLGASAALITLHDWSRYTVTTAGLVGQQSRQDRSLVGMAVRPVNSDALNLLGKLEWRRTLNPLGGAAGASTVLGSTGEDKRLLGAADAVLRATALTEIAARYAVRWSASDQLTAPTGEALGIRSQYLGARVEQAFARDGVVRLRADARMLLEQASGAAPWSFAPSLALRVGPRLELEGGYRMGELLDRDFAANGGSGLFATVGVRFTENLIGSPAAFWRDRISGDR